MDKDKLYKFIEEPDTLTTATEETLKTVVETYPFFQTSRLLYTKYLDMTDSDRYVKELGTTAVMCADRRKLFYLIYRKSYRKQLTQPEAIHNSAKDRTEELLDSFLTSLGGSDMSETTTLDNEALNIVSTDYFSYLEPMEGERTAGPSEDRKLQHHDIIDAFIEKAATEPLFTPYQPEVRTDNQKATSEEDAGEFLTETLAKIYIKQKKYEQALTIIKRLSLNFPKKSIYFADQIRFLEFLIMNQRFR